MITIFLYFIIGGISLSLFLKKRIEECYILLIGLTICILYIFYIFNALLFGTWFLISFIIAILLFIFIKGIKERSLKREFLKNILTPGFIIFIVIFIIIYLFTIKSSLFMWDELRLWAAYPKVLYYTFSEQFSPNTPLLSTMKMYTPGMPLYLYFLNFIGGSFKDTTLFFGYYLMLAMCFLPVTKYIKKSNWYNLFIIPIAIVFLPIAFANSGFDYMYYYNALFIDPLLGAVWGFSIFQTLRNPLRDKYNTFAYLVLLFTMIILKNTGIVFAGISIILLICLQYRKLLDKKIKSILCLIPIILFMISWNLVTNFYNVSNKFEALAIKPSSEQVNFIVSYYLKALVTAPVINSNVNLGVSFLPVLIFFILIQLCLLKMIKSIDLRKNYLKTIIAMFFGTIIFLGGLLYIYVADSSIIPLLSSFERYISTILFAYLIVIFLSLYYIFYKDIKINKTNIKNFKLLVLVMLVFLSLFSSLRPVERIDNKWDKTWEKSIDKADFIISELNSETKPVNIFYVSDKWNDETHHMMYYYLIDEEIYIKNEMFDMNISDKSIEETIDLLSNCEYIYIDQATEEIKEYVEREFKLEVESNTIYKSDLFLEKNLN